MEITSDITSHVRCQYQDLLGAPDESIFAEVDSLTFDSVTLESILTPGSVEAGVVPFNHYSVSVETNAHSVLEAKQRYRHLRVSNW